jgi:hypothetical protein
MSEKGRGDAKAIRVCLTLRKQNGSGQVVIWGGRD